MSDAISPHRSLGLLISDLARLFRKRFEQVARARSLGLSRAQAAVIIHLSRNEGTNQAKLANIMELEPITLVRLLDRLQAAGLIERRPDALDRRARILFLTPAARPLLERILLVGEEVQREATAGMSPAQTELMLDFLWTMRGNVLEQLADHSNEQANAEREVALNA